MGELFAPVGHGALDRIADGSSQPSALAGSGSARRIHAPSDPSHARALTGAALLSS